MCLVVLATVDLSSVRRDYLNSSSGNQTRRHKVYLQISGAHLACFCIRCPHTPTQCPFSISSRRLWVGFTSCRLLGIVAVRRIESNGRLVVWPCPSARRVGLYIVAYVPGNRVMRIFLYPFIEARENRHFLPERSWGRVWGSVVQHLPGFCLMATVRSPWSRSWNVSVITSMTLCCCRRSFCLEPYRFLTILILQCGARHLQMAPSITTSQ